MNKLAEKAKRKEEKEKKKDKEMLQVIILD